MAVFHSRPATTPRLGELLCNEVSRPPLHGDSPLLASDRSQPAAVASFTLNRSTNFVVNDLKSHNTARSRVCELQKLPNDVTRAFTKNFGEKPPYLLLTKWVKVLSSPACVCRGASNFRIPNLIEVKERNDNGNRRQRLDILVRSHPTCLRFRAAKTEFDKHCERSKEYMKLHCCGIPVHTEGLLWRTVSPGCDPGECGY
ncbi:13407_t:CDS:2 [Ambispora gerdemannii]|uniref:13407_t:CDS:1 n=1 Tax=Ambispora gerdemannii TaxID=144530 RepID=A0A9N8W1H3_9GLOM|nr:13407_t:CDS:2 [Ambispora gerdemannii]